ncbi:nuclear transport factor 2 family protein [Microbacterium sp.]|uniref:nuclear transport factor 2 family protein n=1 Tax=Microbacterium sp. TaxID=51671 RepID=UPI0037C5C39A
MTTREAPEDGFTRDEIADLRKLLDIERIRKKKVLYSHLIDSRDFAGFADLYTEDAVGEWGPFGNWSGREQIHDAVAGYLASRPAYSGLHITSNMWIEKTGQDTATSRCYLHDVNTEQPPNVSHVAWFAVYEEDWVRIGGDWKISHHRIYFLWPSREVDRVSGEFPHPIEISAIG